MLAFMASFSVILGMLQFLAVNYQLRGVSMTGTHRSTGFVISILLIVCGIGLAAFQPIEALLLSLLPALLVSIVVTVGFGIALNRGNDLSSAILSGGDDSLYTLDDVAIPVQLHHVAMSATTTWHSMPATYLKPKAWHSNMGSSAEASKDPGKTGAAILVICGAGDTRTAFKWRLFDALLRQNLAVLSIDPPGHGDFIKAPMTVANARICAQAALDWLCNRPEVHTVGALGISFGGNQVIDLATRDRRIKAITSISTPVMLSQVTRQTYLGEVASLFTHPRNLGLLRDGSLLTYWHEWRKLKGAWYGESLYDMIDQLDTLNAIRAIKGCSWLFVHGTSDVAIPSKNAMQLYEAADEPRELIMVSQATHLSPIMFPGEITRIAQWFKHSLCVDADSTEHA